MSRRSITVEEIPLVSIKGETAKPGQRKVLEMTVAYGMGGMSYFSGNRSPRGYFVAATPMTVEQTASGFTSKSFLMFSGLKSFLEPANRYSEKTLAKLAASVKGTEAYEKLKAAVIAQEQLVLAAEEVPANA